MCVLQKKSDGKTISQSFFERESGRETFGVSQNKWHPPSSSSVFPKKRILFYFSHSLVQKAVTAKKNREILTQEEEEKKERKRPLSSSSRWKKDSFLFAKKKSNALFPIKISLWPYVLVRELLNPHRLLVNLLRIPSSSPPEKIWNLPSHITDSFCVHPLSSWTNK